MSKHTPGPWHIVEGRTYGSLEVFSEDTAIAEIWRRGNASLEMANARRIVACINACEGFSTEELDGANLFADSIASDAEIIALKKQRDELLEAVQYAADVFAEYVALHKAKGAAGAEKAQSNQHHLQVMLEAIAKAGGGS